MPIYVAWYVCFSAEFNTRTLIMSILVTIWGLRLTYNFSRKGGYSIYFWRGEEDYRWKEVRKSITLFRSNFNWTLFNLLFICFYQMGLIFLFTLPILAASILAKHVTIKNIPLVKDIFTMIDLLNFIGLKEGIKKIYDAL